METKQEVAPVWSQPDNEAGNATQVHFEGGTVAQIVYSGDQQERGPQQVVYAADGSSYASVESAEHTLVYIHPADGAQTVFTDQPQLAYIQQDGTTQQVTVLLPSGQNMNAANLHVLSNVAEAPQALLEPVPQVPTSVSAASLATMAVGQSSLSHLGPLGATDSALDSDEDEDDDEADDSDLDDWDLGPLRPFNPQDLWCEECNNAHPSVCLKHGPLHPISNRLVLSKARASLPLVLYLDRFSAGVYSKRRIPKRTQFGPVEGPLVRQSELQDDYIQLKVCMLDAPKDEQREDTWVELSDEDRCNWMMFVRPAQNHLEQNLVAYQYGADIYYTTIKNIQPKQELKVWYAASYAEFVNQKIHDITDEERKVLREQEKNWPCYECNRRFMSSEQLQQHLNMHDDKLDFVTRGKGRSRGRGRKRFGTGRRPGRPPKLLRPEISVEIGEDRAQDILGFSPKGPFGEGPDGALNGLRDMDLGAQGGVPGTPPRLDSQDGLAELPPSSELAPVTDSPETPLPGADPPESPKEDTGHGNQADPHLTPEDMRRARRIRNAALQHLFIRKTFRPYKCSQCGKAFREKDKLDQHLRYHGRSSTCPLTCHVCNKGFLNSAALEAHLRLHADQKTYSCLFCAESFDRLDLLKEHVGIHLVDGRFSCPSCKKRFSDFIQVKKHVRSFHSEKTFQCTECDKAFCRPDKLRLHMLRHSDRKDFLCSTCGKQFKRKDKLREHMQRMHNPEREAKKADRIHRSKTLKQKVPTTDIESFMFKCRLCMMGFRRRGMLVNHLSKRHPEMRIEEVPELTLPIIKPNRDYFCQYCDKVYKSASKRKAHILKNHPGAELPPSIRKLRPAGPGEPDPMLSTHTQLTGTIATAPVCCPHCAKQYSSKTKMVQHIRKKHPEFAQLANSIQAPLATAVISSAPAVITADGTAAEAVVTTDLLTQAMTELSQTLTTDYRGAQGDYQRIQYIPVSQAGGALAQPQHIQLQVVQVAPAPSPQGSQHSTVDVSQLHDPSAYGQHSIQVQHIQVTEATAAGQGGAQVTGQALSPSSQQELSPTQLAPVTLAQGNALQTTSSQQGAVQHTYLPGNWNYRGYPSEIQMMTLPHAQYVITETGAPVTTVNSSQVKTTHYVISEGQAELDPKLVQASSQVHPDQLEQQTSDPQAPAQYIITTTTNGNGSSEVQIAKP
ncbi:PR domain zinc finger protein 10-like isoform X2 [Conger conger]|uniref:PR domain zinc finger protein 10-like isoform X2 n=1 Tax=Conger conger TaxID=82655 RepID=UPI002A5AFE07|nr:PR domain zinc finger protein 10-like isoform X2 [Conger conger]